MQSTNTTQRAAYQSVEDQIEAVNYSAQASLCHLLLAKEEWLNPKAQRLYREKLWLNLMSIAHH